MERIFEHQPIHDLLGRIFTCSAFASLHQTHNGYLYAIEVHCKDFKCTFDVRTTDNKYWEYLSDENRKISKGQKLLHIYTDLASKILPMIQDWLMLEFPRYRLVCEKTNEVLSEDDKMDSIQLTKITHFENKPTKITDTWRSMRYQQM